MTTPATLDFGELFASTGVLGHVYSDRLAELDGQTVRMRGFLAPAGGGVLALTREPVAPCSEHERQAWPDDAVFVLAEGGETPRFPAGREVDVEGVLEHGSRRLEDAGVTSFVRLSSARWASD